MLTAANLTVRQGGRRVLREIAFTVRRGAVTGLIGPNGVGKSTLLRAVAGLLPHEGSIRIDGQPPPADARARLIGYLPQGHQLHWPLTVRRTVELGRLPHLGPGHQLRILGLLRAEALERARAVLVVLHDLSLAARSCDDLILLLPDGRVIGGPTCSVLTPDRLHAAYGVRFAVTQGRRHADGDPPERRCLPVPNPDWRSGPCRLTSSYAKPAAPQRPRTARAGPARCSPPCWRASWPRRPNWPKSM